MKIKSYIKKLSSVGICKRKTGWGRRVLGRAQTGLLLPHQLHHPLHLRHPLHHLGLEQLVLVDACSQLINSLLSLPLHLRQPSIAGSIDVSPERA